VGITPQSIHAMNSKAVLGDINSNGENGRLGLSLPKK
jgi:hypothetical protein